MKREQCSTCKFYKPFVNYKMGNCWQGNSGKATVYNRKCDEWKEGKNK